MLTLLISSNYRDILKSLGATSRLLTESISERGKASCKSAKHKVEKSFNHSRDKMETWTLGKTKKAQKHLQKLTTGLKPKKESMSVELDNRHTLPATDEVFKEISFTSPMNSTTGAIEDLSRLSVYEVPKRVNEKLPSYDEVVKDRSLNFKRNDLMTKSFNVSPPQPSFRLVRNLSETNLKDIKESEDSDSSIDSLPPPKYPAPVLPPEGLYGRIKKVKEDLDSDDEVTLRNHPAVMESNRGTFDVTEDLPSLRSSISNDKCESWSYMDQSLMLEEECSSPEPIYENNSAKDSVYEMISEMQTNLLKPVATPIETIFEEKEAGM